MSIVQERQGRKEAFLLMVLVELNSRKSDLRGHSKAISTISSGPMFVIQANISLV